MKMITGFLEPDAGTGRIGGHDVWRDPAAAKARLNTSGVAMKTRRGLARQARAPDGSTRA
ncbi:hypothetical protein TP2_15825 [Thioclava pacifica DSM 10166]|uniref:Uncharacterized protein n=1 Tax=Thioclava pacifica DSM 10166 TaxID=1353537 RepID=A0A074JCA0_9RHOB|nr:hypothetical protein TP2_15825 [Thioclava pacifica DSM 10166]